MVVDEIEIEVAWLRRLCGEPTEPDPAERLLSARAWGLWDFLVRLFGLSIRSSVFPSDPPDDVTSRRFGYVAHLCKR